MRVLWVCNLILPEFAEEFSIKHTCFGGWMSGMLTALLNEPSIELGCCFPIIDECRMKRGNLKKCQYYSFHASMDKKKYTDDFTSEFLDIYHDFNPDIIYIWGTEYNHARAAVSAAIKADLMHRVIIHVQGYVGYYALHYANGIPEDVIRRKSALGKSIMDEIRDFVMRGENEKWILRHTFHVAGRTEWDRICSLQMNPRIHYHYCGEILRSSFYENMGKWNLIQARRNRIFLSQASYSVKGLHIFLRALIDILNDFPDIEIHIAGTNPIESGSAYGSYVSDMLCEYDKKGKIKFLGPLSAEDMVLELLMAHVFVSPSAIENSSNSIGEAMCLGCPVIASFVGGTPSLIQHNKNGLLYPFDAHYMLAGYIKEIFKNDDLAEHLSCHAKQMAQKRYEKKRIVQRTIDIYRNVVDTF